MSALTINVKINLAECQETVETDNVTKNADGYSGPRKLDNVLR